MGFNPAFKGLNEKRDMKFCNLVTSAGRPHPLFDTIKLQFGA